MAPADRSRRDVGQLRSGGVVLRLVAGFLLAAVLWLGTGPGAQAQSLFNPTPSAPEEPTRIPADLTPEQVDGLLARLTDAQIRELLADELRQRAEGTVEEEMSGAELLDLALTRLDEFRIDITERVPGWFISFVNLQERFPEFEKRIDSARSGLGGMVLATLIVVMSGLSASLLVIYLTRNWRYWLRHPPEASYWNKVIRTIALGILELLPIAAFVIISRFAFSVAGPDLGPMSRMEWIYEAGVAYTWIGLVVARRLFAPYAPLIRIAPLDDDLALRIYRVLRLATLVGLLGWLMGGSWLHLGFGFGPARLTVTTGGTIAAVILLMGMLNNVEQLRNATRAVFGEMTQNTLTRCAVVATPWGIIGYICLGYLFWLAQWIRPGGQHHLLGPAGTLVVYLILPILDRLGRELVRSLLTHPGEMAERFREVFYLAWRIVIGLLALIVVLWLWGVNLFTFLSGGLAPPWAEPAIDIITTLLITWLIWRLIRAALHTDKKFVSTGEDLDPSLAPKATRLDTLTPLFRGIMLAFVVAIGIMFTLSFLGLDIGPLLASAGIIGIAVGFGAQALVRDVFSGMFFLIDDAFRVGEYIEMSEDLRGDVESISIRSLQLRHHRGPVITIPFGEIKNITNHTRDWILYKMPFRMEPDTDPAIFKKIVKKVGFEFMEHPDHGPKFFEPLKSQGVYFVDDDSALVFRVKFKCKPRAQFVLRREIYHRLRQVFEENGLKLARRKVEVVSGDDEKLTDTTRGAVPEEMPDPVV